MEHLHTLTAQGEYSADKRAQAGAIVQLCNSRQTHCRTGKGFDRFPAVIDLYGYVNAEVAVAAAVF